jgi:type II secretory pathway pseudopilin PulG
MKIRNRTTGRAGFSVLELSIGMAILLLLIGGLMQSLVSLSRGTDAANVQAELQVQAEQAQTAILHDLKLSGFATSGGNAFPYLFVDGNALGAYAASAHPPATHTAVAGDPDFGVNREIVFLQPADADLDNRPDVDGNSQMVWSGNQFSYVLVTRADGVNVLQRRVDGLNQRTIATHVERVTFDDNGTSGFVVPLSAIRARIWFRKPDERGTIHRFFCEAVVKLRNG